MFENQGKEKEKCKRYILLTLSNRIGKKERGEGRGYGEEEEEEMKGGMHFQFRTV